jgi:hypothetical protein
MDLRFYVYVIFRLDGSPCYIGKGTGNRWKQHGYKGRDSNWRLVKLIDEAGGDLPTVIIRDGMADDEAKRMEIAFIKAIGRGHKGPLVNFTDGGEGLTGTIMPEEIRSKISAAHKGKPKSSEHCAAMGAGRKALFAARRAAGIVTTLSEAHRAAIGRGNKGKTISDAAKAAVSRAHKGQKLSPDHAAKFSRKGHKQTPEQIAKRMEATRATKSRLGNSEGFG